jgi:two-component sensor histidine kinase
LTQRFYYKIKGNVVHFENRFSKVNATEAIVVVRNRTEEIENEEKLMASIKEKEILLKEVHHRVKNNLQIINSILNLQSSYVTDEKTLDIINESQNRIRSMSYIHESLYQTSNFSSINFRDYIGNLITNLFYSYQVNGNINVVKKIENIDLALDQAIPCGLILNELITNSLKYAYDSDEKGDIVIELKEKGNSVHVSVEDYGVGLPGNFDLETSESLGLSLVHTLIDQIDGEVIVNSDGGTKFLIIFEKLES